MSYSNIMPKTGLQQLFRLFSPAQKGMAALAGCVLYFIQNKSILICGDLFMALDTGNIHMLDIKLVCGCIMVKLRDLPAIGLVAPRALRHPVDLKLLNMGILMAIGAHHREAREFLRFSTVRSFPEMTNPAILLRMRF